MLTPFVTIHGNASFSAQIHTFRMKTAYKRSICQAIEFLEEVQHKKGPKGTANRGIGGFGHALSYPLQRIDVTGLLSSSVQLICCQDMLYVDSLRHWSVTSNAL